MLLMGPGIIPPIASYSRSAEPEGGNRCSLIPRKTLQASQGDHHYPSLKERAITRARLHGTGLQGGGPTFPRDLLGHILLLAW